MLRDFFGKTFVPDVPPSNAWIESVVRQARASIADPNVWAILCTGRVGHRAMSYRVAELLKNKGLDFDEVYLNDLGTKTTTYKQKVAVDTHKNASDQRYSNGKTPRKHHSYREDCR